MPCTLQRRYSVAKIETSQTYEKGRPKLGGLSDPRMGTMDRALKVGSWLECDALLRLQTCLGVRNCCCCIQGFCRGRKRQQERRVLRLNMC